MAQRVKHLPAIWVTWVWSLGQEDPLRIKWQATPVVLPGIFHRWRSLVSYSPWDCKELQWLNNFTSHEAGSLPLLAASSPDSNFHLFRVKTGLAIHIHRVLSTAIFVPQVVQSLYTRSIFTQPYLCRDMCYLEPANPGNMAKSEYSSAESWIVATSNKPGRNALAHLSGHYDNSFGPLFESSKRNT